MIPFADPGRQYSEYRQQALDAVGRVLDSGWYVLGEQVACFEQEFAAYCEGGYGVGVGNGTDAITIALRSFGIGTGDEVIVPSHTAVATAAGVEACGAKAVFADVEERYYTLDPVEAEKAITPKTRAIVAVHLYGNPADLDALAAICREHDLRLIEDCAQAHGALYHGHKVGSIGDAGCFSFYPTKNLGTPGDGGMIVFSDEGACERARQLRQYGWDDKRQSQFAGVNSRLDEMHAAILREQLRHLDGWNQRRREIAGMYDARLKELDLVVPEVREGCEGVYHLYVVRVKNRDIIRQKLREKGIGASIHYPQAAHQQRAYRRDGLCLPVTEKIVDEILTLPMFPQLRDDEVNLVCQSLDEILSEGL